MINSVSLCHDGVSVVCVCCAFAEKFRDIIDMIDAVRIVRPHVIKCFVITRCDCPVCVVVICINTFIEFFIMSGKHGTESEPGGRQDFVLSEK